MLEFYPFIPPILQIYAKIIERLCHAIPISQV